MAEFCETQAFNTLSLRSFFTCAISGLSEPNIIHDDEEGARAMARMDELEKLEEEACSDDEDSDFECSSMFSVCQQAVNDHFLERSYFISQ